MSKWASGHILKRTVAAIFQKDPQCLIAHPNTEVKTLPKPQR
ncbi:hypothetical protein NIES4071_90270 [Calothrix sp. NIES-4071]|nr:hypothetical protein NIES4071_90270 [Calothrix sp. NIES-4071]BAZ63294.1 hypothetical protein NIES4105_90200 [Calothrix sp. NIES-4105]